MLAREQLPDGQIRLTFGLPMEDPAGQVSVVGSFNDWSPGAHPLLGEDGDDMRTASVEVEPGSYHFRYLATDGVWFDDEQVDGIDEFGGVVHAHRAYAPVDDESILGPNADPDAELDADPTLGTGIPAEMDSADTEAGVNAASGTDAQQAADVDEAVDAEQGSDPDPGADLDGADPDGDGEPTVAGKGGKGRRARASAR